MEARQQIQTHSVCMGDMLVKFLALYTVETFEATFCHVVNGSEKIGSHTMCVHQGSCTYDVSSLTVKSESNI